MNRVYKVIWSKAKHCYVVTSEIAKSHTKGESTGRGLKKLAAALLVAAALMGPNFAWAADDTVTVMGTSSTVEQTVYTVDGAGKTFATKESLNQYVSTADAAVQDIGVVKAAEKIGANVTALGRDLEGAKAALSGAEEGIKTLGEAWSHEEKARQAADAKLVEAVNSGITLSDENVLQKNTTTVNADGNVTTSKTAANEMILNKGKDNQITLSEDGIKVGKNSTTMDEKGIYAGSDYDYGTAKAALDATEGKIRGADGDFEVNTDGKVTAKGGVETAGAEIKTGGGSITAGKITGTELNTQGGAITGGMATVTGLTTQGGDISGGNITATGLNTQGGEINGGDIKSSGTIHATGKITGNGLDAGSGAVEGNSLTLKGGDLDAGSGTITTKGNIKADGTITTKNLAVTGGLEMDHITLGSETNNYTDINKGKVTSKIHEISGAVEYTAESIFNKDGSSITVRTNEGRVDSTGSSTVGSQIITQYLGNNAVPGGNNVTRKMIRNNDGTFSMEDKAVYDGKSSTVSQNAKEGIVSETNDGAGNKVTLTQGMDGTYKVETSGTSTEEISGQKIENYKGGLDTNITGNETHHVTQNQTITVTGKSSLSAADIENKASSSIWNHVGEGYNTSWKMTDGKISESIVNGTASNKENTTVDGTKRIITNDKGTGTYNQTATSNNISLKNEAEGTSFTKSESLLDGEKTSVTNPNGSSTINQSAESIVNFVKNSEGTTKTEQSAKDITNIAKNGTITNNAMDVLNKGTNSVINEVGANQVAVKTDSVKAAYGSDTYTTWDDKGITSNTSGNMSNTVGGDLINTVTGDSSLSATNIKNKASTSITSQIGEDGKVKSEMNAEGISNTAEDGTITNDAKTVKTITGNNTVISNNGGTTFANEEAKTPFEEGDERGTKDNTKITGNKVETGKVLTDFAEVANNLDVKGSTTLGRDENTTLTVNSKSTFRDTVKMDKTLAVDGESTFNDKVTITKNGLDVKGGTTTDSLKVTGTSEFGGKAAFKDDVSMDKKLTVKGAAEFKDDVSMGKNLTVTGKTETGILHVNGDGYVGGNLNVEGNIETHDAVLSADSRQVVTGRQLYQTNERVDRLDNRIKKVGANAAALAALRPGDFNPDDKFSIAAGFGSYRNANAAALGLFYRPNENVLLSLGTSFGDGENMVNAGVSVKFGRGKSMAERRKEMADEVSSMRDEMRSQDERIAELEEMLKKQSELIEKLSKES